MEGHAVISNDVLASYAADAARDVAGIHELVDGPRRHRGVKVTEGGDRLTVEVHVELDWGVDAASVGVTVQERVADYLGRMAELTSVGVDVVVSRVTAPVA